MNMSPELEQNLLDQIALHKKQELTLREEITCLYEAISTYQQEIETLTMKNKTLERELEYHKLLLLWHTKVMPINPPDSDISFHQKIEQHLLEQIDCPGVATHEEVVDHIKKKFAFDNFSDEQFDQINTLMEGLVTK